MKNIVSLTVAISLVLLAMAFIAAADVPTLMQYQGFLTDDSGEPLDTMVDMTFTIYDASTGSGVIWTETQDTVTVNNGLFHVLLGSVNPIVDPVFAGTQRWLGITVAPDPEITPRTRLVTTPYAFRAATVDGATGGVIFGDVAIQSDLDLDGDFRATGKATIGPGNLNTGDHAFVAGAGNTASGNYSMVSGGMDNTASGSWSTVSGGHNNVADSIYATIGGGFENTGSGGYSTVGGGEWNISSGEFSTVAGGAVNTASGGASMVGAGAQNTASGNHSGVVAGFRNTAGGSASTVSGGWYNSTSGDYSVIAGGYNDTLTSLAVSSFAFGRYVYLDNEYRAAFFEGYYSGRLGINRDDHDGGIDFPLHVGTDAGNGNGAYLSWGGIWTSGGGKESKENSQPLGGKELLAKISSLPVESWQYKDSEERHVGPVSEDFVEAFDVGVVRADGSRDNQNLAASDIGGVALAGVKELIQENQELRHIIEGLRLRIVELERTK